MTAKPLPFGQRMAIQFHGNMGYAEFTTWNEFYSQAKALDLQYVDINGAPLFAFGEVGDAGNEEVAFFIRTRPVLTEAEEKMLSQMIIGGAQRPDMQKIISAPLASDPDKINIVVPLPDDLDGLSFVLNKVKDVVVEEMADRGLLFEK